MQDFHTSICMTAILKSINTTYRSRSTLRAVLQLPAILIVEAVYNLDGLLDLLLSRGPSVENGTICTGTKDVLK